ncbi:MAG: prenyltransferase [Actinobacteria bacterium]|nr:MAG: prenyltransferase [Actinomycetota bacterium]
MSAPGRLLESISSRGYTHAVVAFVDDRGYPLSVATAFAVHADRGAILLEPVAGDEVAPPIGREVNVVFSHIRPQPGVGYDERRYVSLWGTLRPSDGHLELVPDRVQHWDEEEMTFFEFSERGVPQAHRYMERVSREQGRRIRPQLSRGWLFLRATRLPFLSATFIPVALGISVAALHGQWHWWLAILTLVAAACVHLGLNVANDVFDTLSGADQANVTPTQFSGGSRVILYGLLSMRQMVALMLGFYAVGAGIGLYLAVTRGFWPLFWIGVAGLFISLFYTAPPFRFVHRGIGELTVFLGFGPIMTIGAYYVQARAWSWEAIYASLPVGILVALILYVNEVPDRPGDAAAGKRTLPVRWSKDAVIAVYALAVAAAFGLIAGGAIAGVIPRPCILAVLAAPMAVPVYHALREHYDSPYRLMPFMGTNVQLHMATGMVLILGYVIAIVASHISGHPPAFLR